MVLKPTLEKFRFCKTMHLSYDTVVTASLIRAKVLAGDGITISSDGDWTEWKGGRDLVEQVFPDVGLERSLLRM